MEKETGMNDEGGKHCMAPQSSRTSGVEDTPKTIRDVNDGSKELFSSDQDSSRDGPVVTESVQGATDVQPDTSGEERVPSQEPQDRFDVLSVVIQKLTELVKSSEDSCPHGSSPTKSGGCSPGTDTPPKEPGDKKKTRSKRQNKTHLYKCPSCPCLFAIRKRDLDKGRKILCACCEKLKQANIAASKPTGESPPKVVPLESWKVVCEVCTQWVSDYKTLLYHLASHPGVCIFKCKLCDFVTTKQESIEKHQATHKPKEEVVKKNSFICSVCKTFSTDDFAKMDKHLKTHDQLKLLVLKCSVCGYTCRSEEVLRYHMVTHLLESETAKKMAKSGDTSTDQENMPFKCSICGYGCDKLSTLKSHSWRHAGEQSCSYPVEESEDQQEPVGDSEERKTTDLAGQNTEKTSPSGEVPPGHPGKEDSLKDDDDDDLSRLAIGCCGPKGQTCCSKETSDECHCESFEVPPAQQPVLKVFFKEIVSKPTDIVISEKSKKETGLSGKVTAKSLMGDLGQSSPSEQRSDGEEESQEAEVRGVLEECSSLMSHICNETSGSAVMQEVNKLSGNPQTEKGGVLQKALCYKIDMQTPDPGDRVQRRSGDSGASGESVTDQRPCVNAEGVADFLVITENMDIDCTGSVVEVTTSEETHHKANDPNVVGEQGKSKLALKRALTPFVDGGPPAKKQGMTSSSDSRADPRHSPHITQSGVVTVLNQNGQVSSNPLSCPFCSKSLPDFKNLKKHLLEHCREQVLTKCQKCPAKFSTELLLAEHQRGHGDGLLEGGSSTKGGNDAAAVEPCIAGSKASSRRCSLCDRKFRTNASLYLHEQQCAPGKGPLACFECDFLGTKGQLALHIAETHKKPFKCALCDYMSATPTGVKNHMKFHAIDKRYKCPWCDFSGAYPQSLKSHLKTHASGGDAIREPCEQYKCRFCGYLSCHLPSMKSHMWRHATDPGFDYNARVDEIIKDATPVVPQGDMARTTTTPPQNTVQGNSTKEPVKPRPTKGTLQGSQKFLITASSSRMLIFKCTQCGFQSGTRESLVEHLRGHLMSEGQGPKPR